MSLNGAYSTVATAPSPASSGTSLVVAAGTGSRFFAGKAVIWPASTQPTAANLEVVTITNVSTDTLTITRAQESSSARTVVVGDQIAQGITAGMWDALPSTYAPIAHGHAQSDVTGLVAALAAKADDAATTAALAGKASTAQASAAQSSATAAQTTASAAQGGVNLYLAAIYR